MKYNMDRKQTKEKDKIVSFRLSSNEEKMLRYSALVSKMPISEFIRRSLLMIKPNGNEQK
jgi:hypothetical protein